MGGRGGRSRTTGGGGGTAETATPPEAEQRINRTLPEDVTMREIRTSEDNPSRAYKTEVGGKDIQVAVWDRRDTRSADAEIIFSVDGDFDKGALTGRDARRAAVKILKIVQYDVATRPDGYIYKASAWTGDDYGQQRSDIYANFGFSRPKTPGDTQYGIVQNGKLKPYTPPR